MIFFVSDKSDEETESDLSATEPISNTEKELGRIIVFDKSLGLLINIL